MDRSLGPLEMQVLGLLNGVEALSVAQVQQKLATGGFEYAYTTVLTVLKRLHGKGAVRRRKQGSRHVYRVSAANQALKTRLLQKVRRALFSDHVAPIAALLEGDVSESELRELRRLIDQRLAKK